MHIFFYRHRTSSTRIHSREQVASYRSRKIRSKGLTVPIKQTMELARRKLSGLLASGCEKTHIVNYFRGWDCREKKNPRSLKPAHCYIISQLPYKAIVFPVSPHTRDISQEIFATNSWQCRFFSVLQHLMYSPLPLF